MKMFEDIVRRIGASEEEYAELQAEYMKLRSLILTALGDKTETVEITPIGSFLRGAKLSSDVDPNADVDILIAFKAVVSDDGLDIGVFNLNEWGASTADDYSANCQ